MGMWGSGIFDDDAACDIRESFNDLIAEGLTPVDATARLVLNWGTPHFDPDEEPVFWLALAATQVKTGRLIPSVRDRAIEMIDHGRDLERFADDASTRIARATQLDRLKADLLGPQRKPTAVKRVERHENSWPVGSILTFRLDSGQLCLLRVVDHQTDKHNRLAVVEVLRGTFDRLPSERVIALTPARREVEGNRYFRIILLSRHEGSRRLALTDRGRSPLASLMRSLRTDRSALPGHYLTIIPLTEELDTPLAEHLNLR